MVAWQAAWYYENIDFSAMPFKMRELSQLIKITSFLSGKELRLKLTNYYGKEELIFDEIYVALTADMKEKQFGQIQQTQILKLDKQSMSI